MTNSLAWIAVYVRPRHEKSVAAALHYKDCEVLLPLFTRTYASGKHAELPLFPGYVFCLHNPGVLLPLLTTPGVLSVVGIGNSAATIPVNDIERVRKLAESGLRAQIWPYVAAGQRFHSARARCGGSQAW